MARKSRGLRARKALGQHFLVDSGVLGDIVAAVRVPPGGILLEIGAGTGQLTAALLDAGHDVIALEIEPRLLAHLRDRFAGRDRLRVVEGDARTIDLTGVIDAERPFSVVGNLPYFAANPIVRHLLEGAPLPAELVIMVQREVAREMTATVRRSLLGISVQNYATPEPLFDVPPNAFDPPPAVHSAVVRLTLRETPLVPPDRTEAFFALVSGTFRNPRKQIHNALARIPGRNPDAVHPALEAAAINPTRRPETLAIDEWVALLDALEAIEALEAQETLEAAPHA